MPVTCPRCGMRSSAASEACRECGHGLYRVSYPAPSAESRWNVRALGSAPLTAKLTISVAVLVVGTGVTTGLLLGSGEDEPISKNRVPVTADPRDPIPTAVPSSPKPSKTKTPPAPAPTTTPPPTYSATPSPTRSSAQPIPGISEAEWAAELAEELRKKYGPPGQGRWDQDPPGQYRWGQYEQEQYEQQQYEQDQYEQQQYEQDQYEQDQYQEDGQP
jgi:hypothetical protein